MEVESITRDNLFTGQHTMFCTLETWAQFGWMINSEAMDKIKEYMPIVAHKCNIVSNYSNTLLKRQIADVIEDMIFKNDLIQVDVFDINDDGSDWIDIIEIPSLKSKKYPKQKYLLVLNIGDIKIYIWRKKIGE